MTYFFLLLFPRRVQHDIAIPFILLLHVITGDATSSVYTIRHREIVVDTTALRPVNILYKYQLSSAVKNYFTITKKTFTSNSTHPLLH